MKMGTIWLWGGNLAEFSAQVAQVDELGCDVIGIGDVPPGYHDPYVSLTVAAGIIRKANIGPMITAPQLRHPVANVTAMSALQDLTEGRAVLGIGAGDSIAFGLGKPQPKQAFIRDYILAMRSSFNGEAAVWDGATIKPMRYARKVPIYYSALGPKAMAVAGEVADGVILQIGESLEHVRASIATVRAAAREAGRDPAHVDIWVHAFVSVADTRQEALRAISSLLAAKAPILLFQPDKAALVPQHLRAAVHELQAQYDFRDHALASGKNGPLAERLGLLEFLAGFNTIAGSEAEVRALVKALEAEGVSLMISPMVGRHDGIDSARRLRKATL